MSEEPAGGFLARWSRRKAASRQAEAPPVPESALDEAALELPPIESLGADSDYTAFLARGVSQAVQAQALGIAWASDPVIANFRGMAEYAWDFNAPGYGELAPGDDAATWLSQIVRSGAKVAAAVGNDAPDAHEDGPGQLASPDDAAPAASSEPPPVEAPWEPPTPLVASDVPPVEVANPEVSIAVPVRRHGGAMPV